MVRWVVGSVFDLIITVGLQMMNLVSNMILNHHLRVYNGLTLVTKNTEVCVCVCACVCVFRKILKKQGRKEIFYLTTHSTLTKKQRTKKKTPKKTRVPKCLQNIKTNYSNTFNKDCQRKYIKN